MKIWYLVVVFFFLPCLSYACEVIDDVGQTVKLSHPAERIVSLAPDITELLFASGAGKKIVGVMRGSDFPEPAKHLPVVASFNSVDKEKILSLHPDLIIVWSEGNLSESLKKFGIPIYHSHSKKLTDIPATLKRLGCLAGTEKMADEKANQFLNHYQALQKQYSNKKIISVFYQVWPQPLMTIAKGSWINDIIELCGGKNIFADLRGAAPQVNLESVIVANPDVIIVSQTQDKAKPLWLKWTQLAAVLKHNIVVINPDLVERAGPRILEGASEICMALDRARTD